MNVAQSYKILTFKIYTSGEGFPSEVFGPGPWIDILSMKEMQSPWEEPYMKSSEGNTLTAIESQVKARFTRRMFICVFNNEPGSKRPGNQGRDLRKGRRKEAVTVYFFNVIRHKLILHKPTRVLYAAKGGCFEVGEEKKKRRYCFTEHAQHFALGLPMATCPR